MSDVCEELIDELHWMSDEDLRGLREYLATYPDPVTAAFRRVPYTDRPASEEVLRSLEEHEEFIKNGGKCIPDEEIAREFGPA